MAKLIPFDFDFNLLKPSEREVVSAILSHPDNGWMVSPGFPIHIADSRESEGDIVMVHPTYGVWLVETTEWQVHQATGGYRYQNGKTVNKVKQINRSSHLLVDYFNEKLPFHFDKQIGTILAFPNVKQHNGELRGFPGVIFTSRELHDIKTALDKCVRKDAYKEVRNLNHDQAWANSVAQLLAPTFTVDIEPKANYTYLRRQLEQVSLIQYKSIMSMSANSKVMIEGGAGSGKTRVAIDWAEKSSEHHRVLLTCSNRLLGRKFADKFKNVQNIIAGPFLDLALGFEGMPAIDVVENEEWWTGPGINHLRKYFSDVVESFDTVIVDEAQDFPIEHLEWLENIWNPDSGGNFVLLGDLGQDILKKGPGSFPSTANFAQVKLAFNTRNPSNVAALVKLVGKNFAAEPAPISFYVSDIHLRVANNLKQQKEALIKCIEDANNEDFGIDDILVIPCKKELRDKLNKWDLAGSGIAPGRKLTFERTYRSKGLESPYVVVLIEPNSDMTNIHKYVAFSRSTFRLVVIADTKTKRNLFSKLRRNNIQFVNFE